MIVNGAPDCQWNDQYGYASPLKNTDHSGRCIPQNTYVFGVNIGQEGCDWFWKDTVDYTGWQDFQQYSAGVATGVTEVADGFRTLIAPTPMEQYQQAQMIENLFRHPEQIPDMLYHHFTDPFMEAYLGWLCRDFFRLGHGTFQSGMITVEVAGYIDSLAASLRRFRPRTKPVPVEEPLALDEPTSVNKNPCLNSFTPDTPVATADGEKPIASLKEGDTVLAYNERTGTTGSYTITNTINHTDTVVLDVAINGEWLTTTPEHPFFTTHGWTNAEDLWLTDSIRAADGTWGRITGLRERGANQRMYNLTVADAHTFFVGDGQWLVHNIDCYMGKTNHPKWPSDFERRPNGLKKFTVKNPDILADLRQQHPGKWYKVFEDGWLNGNEVSIHYFEHEKGWTGGVQIKHTWSNP